MLITYDKSNHPTIHIKFDNRSDPKNESFINYMENWHNNYKNKKHFHFYIDLIELYAPNLFVIPDYIRRINVLKKFETQYLDFTIMKVHNSLVKNIINLLFNNNGIVSPVYLVEKEEVGSNLLKYLKNPKYNNNFIESFCLSNKVIIKRP